MSYFFTQFMYVVFLKLHCKTWMLSVTIVWKWMAYQRELSCTTWMLVVCILPVSPVCLFSASLFREIPSFIAASDSLRNSWPHIQRSINTVNWRVPSRPVPARRAEWTVAVKMPSELSQVLTGWLVSGYLQAVHSRA